MNRVAGRADESSTLAALPNAFFRGRPDIISRALGQQAYTVYIADEANLVADFRLGHAHVETGGWIDRMESIDARFKEHFP